MNIQENNTPRATDQSNESSQGSSAQHENSTTIPVENLALKEDGKNLGSGPAPHIADGGIEGEAKQPKEETGKMTNMGGATGGTTGMGDYSEGNAGSSGHQQA